MAEKDRPLDTPYPKAESAPIESSKKATDSTEWCLVHDAETKRDYYFNISTEESCWEPPEGLETSTLRRYEDLHEEAETQIDETHSNDTQKTEWHYIDATGKSQGPFSKEKLLEWRAYFPMNTLMWTSVQMNSDDDEEKSTNKATFLADILGDSHLLQRWRLDTMNSHVNRVAPTATDYELYLQYPANLIVDDTSSQPQPHSSTEQAYADAVIAGLPPEDETVQLADLAKQSGMQLKDIMRFMEQASSDGSTQQLVTKDPRSGKMTAVVEDTQESHQLYAEFGSWIDPAKMEEGLRKSAQYRREKLPSLWMKQVGYKKRTLPWQDERYDRDN